MISWSSTSLLGGTRPCSMTGVPGPLVDYPFDTTRNAVHVVFNGILTRYPNVKIILSHAGGFVPYAALRFCLLQPALQPKGPTADELLAQFKLFYWDTALSSGKYTFATLSEFADPERILFGSDYPYASPAVSAEFTRILDEETGLTAEQATAINSGNARSFSPASSERAPHLVVFGDQSFIGQRSER
ncbi:amidohydrolase family protein [Mycobacterium sp. 155]|uniref:amidohydrolase family protein n=1 Tax=Mycobacterium sp. 155 TaxID=1157943 RepID=UPI001E55D1D1|nr:amidohydrolase family protein [Mycobacterium sp. 155]